MICSEWYSVSKYKSDSIFVLIELSLVLGSVFVLVVVIRGIVAAVVVVGGGSSSSRGFVVVYVTYERGNSDCSFSCGVDKSRNAVM